MTRNEFIADFIIHYAVTRESFSLTTEVIVGIAKAWADTLEKEGIAPWIDYGGKK